MENIEIKENVNTPLFEAVTPMTLERQLSFNKYHTRHMVLLVELLLVLFGAIFALLFFFNDKLGLIIYISLMAVFMIVYPFIHTPLLKKRLASVMKKNPMSDKNTISHIKLYSNSMQVDSKRLNHAFSSATLYYKDFQKVVQLNSLIFLYIGAVQAYIIDTDCLTLNTPAALIDFLTLTFPTKFKIHKPLPSSN